MLKTSLLNQTLQNLKNLQKNINKCWKLTFGAYLIQTYCLQPFEVELKVLQYYYAYSSVCTLYVIMFIENSFKDESQAKCGSGVPSG